MIRVVIMASGSGSNAAALMDYFKNHARIQIVALWTDKANCGARNEARQRGVKDVYLSPDLWNNEKLLHELILEHKVNFILLAGFLKLIPPFLIKALPDCILNIHPALLPEFGGKGMYGIHIHRAVIEAGKTQSGLSIHLVNEQFDEGRILFQKSTDIAPGTTAEVLQKQILALEHRFYPRIAEQYMLQKT